MARPKTSPRKLMELAIEMMRRSVHEPRTDGKINPIVGAVLKKSDGTVETACRGELRNGDHAEYTLLERKNRHQSLDGSSLFTTLEPCAPGARKHPKLSCADRIVLARIKEVWVGIEDPDPKVDRKGIKYLQEQGVVVHMFDRELQEVIRKENKEFVSGALERALTAQAKPKIVALSNLESAFTKSGIKDLSNEALNEYRTIAKINDEVGSASFNRRLVLQGLLSEEGKSLVPTGFGLLLFGKEPRTVFPQAGLLATILYADGKEETRDFDGPLVLIPTAIEAWLENKLPNVVDRATMRRKRTPPLPFEMVREAVVNALVHRDYDIRQAKCQLVITPGTITVKSPGGPLSPINLQLLQSFNAPMLSRNPELHYVFAKMEMAEERGFGLKSLRERAESLHLPLPRYAWEEPYLVLTLFRNPEAATRTLKPAVSKSLTPSEQAGVQWLATKGRAKSNQYAKAMRVDERTARRHLNRFLALRLVRKAGSARSTVYEVI